MRPFNHFTACMLDFSSTQENTARVSARIIRQICTAYSAPPCGMQYIAEKRYTFSLVRSVTLGKSIP